MAVTVTRWSGLFLIIGAVFFGIGVVKIALNPVINVLLSPSVSLLLLLASIFLLLSLPVVYARQASTTGWAGLIGHILLQTGLLLPVIIAATPLLYPSIQIPSGENLVVFLLGIALVFGLLLTGLVTLRAGIFPRWSGILILSATTGFFFVFFVAEFLPPLAGQIGSAFLGIVLALALSWIGLFELTN